MPSSEPRFFLCTGQCVKYEDLYKYPDSHIIGHLCHVTYKSKKVTALARWEVSAPAIKVPPLHPKVDCMMVGTVLEIQCRYTGCHHKESWEISKASFLALMAWYGKGMIPPGDV